MGLSSWSLDHIAFSWRVIPKAFRIKDPWESWNYQRKPWVWTLGGLVTYDVLFFIHLGSRKVHVAGVTPHPNEAWMVQVARNVTMEAWGFLAPGQYLIHDRDTKFCAAFQQLIDAAGVKQVLLPPRSPNLNAYVERWVRSVKEECLSRLILFGEASLRHALLLGRSSWASYPTSSTSIKATKRKRKSAVL